jgi:hypothetical protein
VVLVDEALQQRDHAGRVAADRGHVSKLHVVCLVVDECLQCCGLGGVDGHEDRLSRRDGTVDESGCAGQEVVLVGIDEGLVAKSVVLHCLWTTR